MSETYMPQRILTPTDVAKRLGIPERAALRLMHDLPHANVSRNLNSKRKRLRITEQTLEDYLSGRIEREPFNDKEDLDNAGD